MTTLSYITATQIAALTQAAPRTAVSGARILVLRSANVSADVNSLVSAGNILVLRSVVLRRDRGPIVAAIPFGWNPDEPEPAALNIPYP